MAINLFNSMLFHQHLYQAIYSTVSNSSETCYIFKEKLENNKTTRNILNRGKQQNFDLVLSNSQKGVLYNYNNKMCD